MSCACARHLERYQTMRCLTVHQPPGGDDHEHVIAWHGHRRERDRVKPRDVARQSVMSVLGLVAMVAMIGGDEQ